MSVVRAHSVAATQAQVGSDRGFVGGQEAGTYRPCLPCQPNSDRTLTAQIPFLHHAHSCQPHQSHHTPQASSLATCPPPVGTPQRAVHWAKSWCWHTASHAGARGSLGGCFSSQGECPHLEQPGLRLVWGQACALKTPGQSRHDSLSDWGPTVVSTPVTAATARGLGAAAVAAGSCTRRGVAVTGQLVHAGRGHATAGVDSWPTPLTLHPSVSSCPSML